MARGLKGLSIKRFLPRTLFGRSLMILVTPVLLIQLITSYVFFDRHWTKVTTHLAYAVAGEIAVLTSALEDGSEPEKLGRVMGYANQFLELEVGFARSGVLPEKRSSSFTAVWEEIIAQKLSSELSSMIPNNFVIHPDFTEKKVEVFVQLPEGVLSVDFPQRRLFSSSAYIFLLWMIGTSLLLLIVAVLFMRNQIRPIRKLAVATDRFGKGRDTPFFKPEGASEVRQAGAAFLDMRRRIERQIAQRTDMLTGVSHDLRTPLTRMKLQVEMMPDGADKDEFRQDIKDMETMIHGYLDFVRGDGEEEIAPVELYPLFEKLCAQVARHKDVKTDIDVSKKAVIPARPLAVERALGNVVNNAARYADRIWVKAEADGEKMHIQIDDDGPGIPPDQYDEVFKPFKRMDTSRNAETGGVGLGLAITKDIVNAHGGKIFLGESLKGGLCVSIRLPIK